MNKAVVELAVSACVAVSLASCTSVPTPPVAEGPVRMSSGLQAPAKVQRSQSAARALAAQRQRRIIFNNDGNEPVYSMREASAEALLEVRTTGLLGSQVDSIFYCTWGAGFGYFTHDTKVGNLFTRTEDRLANNMTGELIRAGIDPLAVMVDFARDHDLEIFWSMRMNDAHDSHNTWYGPLLFPPLKEQHPEWLIGTPSEKPVNGRWTSVDYTLQEVRDYAFRFVEEVLNNYDVDGVELDFFRDPLLFRSVARGQPASQEELAMLTDWLERVREMADAVGAARGRPVLIAARVPDSLDYAWKLGMDIEAWLSRDLIDLMVVGGYFRLNPWHVSAELGHRYGVPVYADLSESRQRDQEARQAYSSNLAYRGRAMKAWQGGVDGIYRFNAFDPTSPLWHELGDPKTLRTMDKDYVNSTRGFDQVRLWWKDGVRYMNVDVVAPDYYRQLNPGKAMELNFTMGEDTADASVTLRARTYLLDPGATLSVTIGEQAPLTLEGDGRWRSLTVPRGALREGRNRLAFVMTGQKKQARLVDLQVQVRRERRKDIDLAP